MIWLPLWMISHEPSTAAAVPYLGITTCPHTLAYSSPSQTDNRSQCSSLFYSLCVVAPCPELDCNARRPFNETFRVFCGNRVWHLIKPKKAEQQSAVFEIGYQAISLFLTSVISHKTVALVSISRNSAIFHLQYWWKTRFPFSVILINSETRPISSCLMFVCNTNHADLNLRHSTL